MYENDDGNDKFEAEFKAENIDKNGIWNLENGSTIDILNTTLSLPDGRGDEVVNGVILSTEGCYYKCPLCKEKLNGEGLVLILEKYHYLVARCCNKLFLYENEKLKLEDWV